MHLVKQWRLYFSFLSRKVQFLYKPYHSCAEPFYGRIASKLNCPSTEYCPQLFTYRLQWAPQAAFLFVNPTSTSLWRDLQTLAVVECLSNSATRVTKDSHPIHLIPKWRPLNYSFVCMLINNLRLVNMYQKQKNFEVKMRLRGLINIQTKE